MLQREAIWKVLLPPTLPGQSDVDWAFLARKYALTAAFLAAQARQVMGMIHLLAC